MRIRFICVWKISPIYILNDVSMYLCMFLCKCMHICKYMYVCMLVNKNKCKYIYIYIYLNFIFN